MSNIETIAAYFNSLAPDWPENAEDAPIRDEILRRADIPAQSTILDIGCGKGVMVPHLLKTSPRQIIELDVSKEMIRLGRERFSSPSIVHICGDILHTDLPPVDTAVIFNAYPHLMDKTALAKRLAHILSKEGSVIIAHSKSRDWINGIHRDDGPCEQISVPLKKPADEATDFAPWFIMEDWEDSARQYFIKFRKR